ncbi:tetraacyldisaccharide 4'-kinase [Lyticum sinuosum]|uniref:Tetraacyldisaccharide 4'-kinase n=1 Tax=Lyticum sinuosum TaxID=1332059 RepID=A0AAE5AHR3_9RICK|nr:tetraacyldisaccharide 4'-kinase [Lyticum sinuosum]MDZ5761281.1 Tetraacyldisaccharide 4'-kinase [Lyticum sinuosum]
MNFISSKFVKKIAKNLFYIMFKPLFLDKIYLIIQSLYFKLQKVMMVSVPVISIGNIEMGGTGKTPLVEAMAKRISKDGYKVAILSRGYGRKQNIFKNIFKKEDVIIVDYNKHTAEEVGDEPLLLSKATKAKVYVANNRVLAAKTAMEDGCDIILMDDGHQNFKIQKDFSIIVTSALDLKHDPSLYKTIPFGRLREDWENALDRTEAIVIVGYDKSMLESHYYYNYTSRVAPDVKIFKILAETKNQENYTGKKFLAFTGIGQPEKFFFTLKQCGAIIVEKHVFNDHHRYKEKEVISLIQRAKELEVDLVTTSKDYIKISQYNNQYDNIYHNIYQLEISYNEPQVDRLYNFVFDHLIANRILDVNKRIYLTL